VASAARASLGCAASGINSDITEIAGLVTPLTVGQGGTGAADLTGPVHANGAGVPMSAGPINLAANVTSILPVANGGTGQAVANIVPWPLVLQVSGALASGVPIEFTPPTAFVLKAANARVVTAPSGDDCTIDVLRNGASALGGSKITIADGEEYGIETGIDEPFTTSSTVGIQIENPASAEDLTIILDGRVALQT
jgi:hypothetical protein